MLVEWLVCFRHAERMWGKGAYRAITSTPFKLDWLTSCDFGWEDCEGNAALRDSCDNKRCTREKGFAEHLGNCLVCCKRFRCIRVLIFKSGTSDRRLYVVEKECCSRWKNNRRGCEADVGQINQIWH